MPAAPKSPTQARRAGAPKAKGAVRAKSGCYTCRIRRKKCDEQPNADGSCQTCVRLRLQCLGFGAKRPEWLRASDKVVDLREKIKNFLAAQGMIKGHSGTGPRPSDQEPSILSLSADYASPSTSPQTPTLSISSDERHPGIARNDYLRGDTDARLPVMQDIDSPLDARDNYPGVMLPAYPSSNTSYTTSLEPSWQSTALSLPRPHTSDFSATYNAYFPDEDDKTVIPSGFLVPPLVNTIHYNWLDVNSYQNAQLHHYMEHVLRIQYLHADGSIDKLIWNLIHSSDTAREATCLLADLHRKSIQGGAIGYSAPANHDMYARIQRAPVTEGDALASLCMVSYFLFSGGQGQWQAFLDSACEFSIKFLNGVHRSPDWALISCNDSMRFIIKTSIWFDVLASATLIRPPKFLDVLRSFYDPDTAFNSDRPELSMMRVMGCENRIVLGLAEIANLACWKDEHRRAGKLSVPELVRHGQRIEALLKPPASDSYQSRDNDTEKSRRRRLTSDVFRASALVYLHSVISGDHPQCPEIVENIAETVKCLKRAEDMDTARHVVRSVVFSICICGCLTDNPVYRSYFLQRLHEQQNETVGNCARVAELMQGVWKSRERGEPVDWRVVMRQSQMLLV
ncbi:fungal-specific transcription factor domain-containing protein [Suillus clintonianus]|uniref:fungal-specific transcription factor domain-containing protein n=1 Tax=Suillus clintonianus TaxID=1904413 RepID=UPI001B87282D|nr:fungal-specific transcription factor domain-containing protein [Suillus clintonianus]KAG2154035.1 fungal-specific transcription factor domain-containing protein [Suillus clintonianus]